MCDLEMMIKLGFEQRPGLLFPNGSLLSKPFVWLGDYAFGFENLQPIVWLFSF